MIHFAKHAEEKFEILARHDVVIQKEQVITTIEQPKLIDKLSRFPLIIAQTELDKDHVLRIIYKQENNIKTVITFYPGRKKQYGQ